MTLDRLRPLVSRINAPFVRAAVTYNISPDAISWVGFFAAVCAGASFFIGGWWYFVAAGLVLFNGWLDVLDGAVARKMENSSRQGDLLDHVLDRYADIVIITGLAAGVGEFVLGFFAVTGVLMTSYLGTQSIAVGLDRVYGGLLGRADRLVLVGMVGVLMPVTGVFGRYSVVGWLLVVFGVIGHLTAVQRFYYGLRALERE